MITRSRLLALVVFGLLVSRCSESTDNAYRTELSDIYEARFRFWYAVASDPATTPAIQLIDDAVNTGDGRPVGDLVRWQFALSYHPYTDLYVKYTNRWLDRKGRGRIVRFIDPDLCSIQRSLGPGEVTRPFVIPDCLPEWALKDPPEITAEMFGFDKQPMHHLLAARCPRPCVDEMGGHRSIERTRWRWTNRMAVLRWVMTAPDASTKAALLDEETSVFVHDGRLQLPRLGESHPTLGRKITPADLSNLVGELDTNLVRSELNLNLVTSDAAWD